jgi:hypothetical protein
MMYIPEIEHSIRMFHDSLSERDRRRYAAIEAAKLGHGGIEYVATLLGCDPKTIRQCQQDLDQLPDELGLRVRKNGMTNRKIEYWVIPPEADGEFVAHMEEVLETYARPYDLARPVLCMDEQPVQLLKEARVPIPATRRHGKRVDYEDERAGTANIFMFAEPLAGWREVAVRETKTKVDWAIEMAALVEGRYAGAERVIVVCDNLNTHTKGAFYEVFAPSRARRLVRRIEFCYTPKHGSWLNIAENELSALMRQCVAGRRFGDPQALRAETSAWSSDVNSTQRGVDWQMKIDDARCKLASVYPKIKL